MRFFLDGSNPDPFVMPLTTPSQNEWAIRKSGGEIELRRTYAAWVMCSWWDGLVPVYVWDGELFVGINDPTNPEWVEWVMDVSDRTESAVVAIVREMVASCEVFTPEKLTELGFVARAHRGSSELEI
jgi:hypothetical protein